MKEKYIDDFHKEFLLKIQKEKRIILFTQIFIVISFLFLWEVCAYTKIIDVFVFSKPSRIYELTCEYFSENKIFKHINQSLTEVILGLIFGTSIGILIAIFLWLSKTAQKIVNPFLIVLNALPKTALAPIFIIWVGTDIKGIVFVAISISLVITVINTLNGFNSVDSDQLKMLKSFNANKLQQLKYLVLPANYDNIISITRINIGMTWIGVIVGEFIVSKAGIGYLITYGTQTFRLDLVMMSVLILAVLTMLMNMSFDCLLFLIKKSKRKLLKKGKK